MYVYILYENDHVTDLIDGGERLTRVCRPILLDPPEQQKLPPKLHAQDFLTSQTRPDIVACERLDLLAAAVDPPLIDLRIRVIAELHPLLGVVCPLVRVPRGDRLALELCRHRSTHRRVARTLLGPIGQVEDRLVQTGRLLRRRRTRQPGATDQRIN